MCRAIFVVVAATSCGAFVAPSVGAPRRGIVARAVTQQEAERVIGLAKQSIARDATVKAELGKLTKVENVLGFGSPSPGVVAVSFNASFRRQNTFFITISGERRENNRGKTVGKVSARLESGKLASVVISKDGGWGKTINVAVRYRRLSRYRDSQIIPGRLLGEPSAFSGTLTTIDAS
eukprot:CAMPEP_0197415428 /NCGR_PEP_ID=MMETSP1170-20131217/1967_1 /TAXON_ID=54406 /ORGANISM="Sarcinochrysis sp, Strain CCMP770" /LENGTH=177 /DNA_ID=CAMNT_0042942229 /DNA_START=20 /DNA_END=554 /DNA_ORIENTATION=-